MKQSQKVIPLSNSGLLLIVKGYILHPPEIMVMSNIMPVLFYAMHAFIVLCLMLCYVSTILCNICFHISMSYVMFCQNCLMQYMLSHFHVLCYDMSVMSYAIYAPTVLCLMLCYVSAVLCN